MKLKQKIILVAILLCAVPLVLLALSTASTVNRLTSNSLHEISQQRLIAIRDVKKWQIENYFSSIKNQLLSLAFSEEISSALVDFTKASKLYASETMQLDRKMVTAELKQFYDYDFTDRYRQLNPDSEHIDTQRLINKLDSNSLALQNTFIARNTADLDDKDSLVDSEDGSQYNYFHTKYHPYLHDYMHRFGFDDILLVDADTGMIVYSVVKKLDYATSLKNGAYAESVLGKTYRAALKIKQDTSQGASISDFEHYTPTYEDDASFIATPIFVNGSAKGVLIFQMPVDRINKIMTYDGDWETAGLGKTGETYIVGSDMLAKSESRFLLEDKSSFLSKLKQTGHLSKKEIEMIDVKNTVLGIEPITSLASKEALSGKTGFAIFPDIRGEDVLSAYTPLEINGLNWALLAEMDKSEAFSSIDVLTEALWMDSLIILVITLIIGSVIAFFLAGALARPILAISTFISSVADKLDLTARLDLNRNDEIGDAAEALNNLLQTFHKSMIDVLDASVHIASASEETSVITTQTSHSLKTQLSETDQVATAMNEMTATVNEVAKNTTQTSTSSDEAYAYVDLGTKAMQQTIAIIHELATIIERTNASIIELERHSIDISSVLDVISGIAEQTNLLALNAAIEAARAGEHGRGFSVVASEVRNLASRTQESTGEVTKMIEQLQNGAKDAVISMEQSKSQVSNAVEQANSTGVALNTIAEAIHRINDMSSQIATAAEQQGVVAEEINRNVLRINDMTEQAAEGGVQTSEASKQLAVLASGLHMLVQRFTV